MTELNQDYVDELHRAMVEAICKVSAARQQSASSDRGDTLYIGTAEVCQALTHLLTDFLEGVPGLDKPGDVRQLSDTVARKIRRGIAEIRRDRDATGGAPLPSIVIRGN